MPGDKDVPLSNINAEIVQVDPQRLLDFQKQLHRKSGQKSLLEYLNLGDLKLPQFTKINCSSMDFSDSDLSNVYFIQCDFTEAKFPRSTLYNIVATFSNFTKANFTDAHLEHSNLENATFDHARFNRGSFIHNDLTGATLEKTLFDGGIQTDLSKEGLKGKGANVYHVYQIQHIGQEEETKPVIGLQTERLAQRGSQPSIAANPIASLL